MSAQLTPAADDAARLRRCLNDLISMMALPALWAGGEPRRIIGTLLDVLAGTLEPAFVFARLNDVEGGHPLEIVRVADAWDGVLRPRELGRILDVLPGDHSRTDPAGALMLIDGIPFHVAAARLRLHGEIGSVVVGSERQGFPGQTERLILDVAANQAAIGLQQARLLLEQKQVAADLDRRVAQRTSELRAAVEALQREVSERRRAEQALTETEQRARLILDSIPGLIGLLDAAGGVELVNPQILEYTGLTLEELRRWGTSDIVHPEDLPHVIDVFGRSIAAGIPYSIAQRLRRADGAYRWFQNNGCPIRDASGRVSCWCVLLTDIDDRKQAEESLQRSEAFLIEGQHLARVGNFLWRLATNEVTWSEPLYRIFEFEPGTPVTLERIAGVVHPEDVPLLDDMLDRAKRGVSDFAYEHRLLMPDGTVKHLHLIAHRSPNEHGRLEYIGAVQDVTHRRASEEALGQARAELSHMARALSLGMLTASIAHEVNQPLSGIVTNASTCLRMLAPESPDIDGARETARRTIRDANRASDVITRLRALFSRKDSAQESLDLNEATREVVALSAGELQRQRVVVRSDLADELPSVTGDRVQLQQVILNLLRNASEAMDGVDDRLRLVAITTGRDGDNLVRLTVRDTGTGVNRQTMDRLFDAFFTTKTDGMGIGLSVSRSIIERHRGRLWVEPNDGPGVTFSFSIPCSPPDRESDPAPMRQP